MYCVELILVIAGPLLANASLEKDRLGGKSCIIRGREDANIPTIMP